MRCQIAMLLLGLVVVAPAAQASACKTPATTSEARAAGHQYVVKARVVRVRPAIEGGVVPVMFSVMRKYHGNAPQVLTVDFDPHDPRPLSFHPAEVYLLSTLPSPGGAVDRGIGNACTLRQLIDVR